MQASALVFFADVVDAGSFAAAARKLGLDRSNVSRRIQEMETALACQLLRRSTRSMELTEAGAFFYERCCLVRAEVTFARDSLLDMTGAVRGRLTLSCPPMLGREVLAPLLAEFCRRYPLVDLRLTLRNYIANLIPAKVDVCLTITHAPAPDTVARRLADVAWQLCASPAYLAARPVHDDVDALTGLDWVDLFERDTVELEDVHGPHRIKVRTRLACQDLSLVRTALVQGLGVGVLPDYIAGPALRDGSLVQILPRLRARGTPGDGLYAITLPTRYMPSKVKALVEFLVRAFAQSPHAA